MITSPDLQVLIHKRPLLLNCQSLHFNWVLPFLDACEHPCVSPGTDIIWVSTAIVCITLLVAGWPTLPGLPGIFPSFSMKVPHHNPETLYSWANHNDWSPQSLHTWKYQKVSEMFLMFQLFFQWLLTACQSQKSLSTAYNNYLSVALFFLSIPISICYLMLPPKTHFSWPVLLNDLVSDSVLDGRIQTRKPSEYRNIAYVWILLDYTTLTVCLHSKLLLPLFTSL